MAFRILRIVLILLIPLIILMISTNWILEWLWLREVGYSEVFQVLRSTQIILFFGSLLIVGGYLILNFRILSRRIGTVNLMDTPFDNLNIQIPPERQQKWINRFFTIGAVFIALMFALSIVIRWDDSLRFLWGQPFGDVDPIFGHDIGFYMFQLPFLELIQSSLSVITFLTTLILALVYFFTDQISAKPGQGFRASSSALWHVKLNAAIWLVFVSIGFFLSRYDLLYREDGVVFGAGYTHVAIELPALWIAFALTLAIAAMLIASRWVTLNKPIIGVAGLVVIVLIGGRAILPSAVQQLQVDPNELQMETPYIENNIEMTRKAYGLDDIRNVRYSAEDTLTAEDIRPNQDVIENIRLWDPRLLIQTYRQLQEIRPYYSFNDVDIDRYTIAGNKEQVMLSARELVPQLPTDSDTWVNRHLQFTHGFGLAMSPVTRTNRQGEPLLYIRDLPPVTRSGLNVDNPAIYYGERSGDYYIVNTSTEELHYPSGDGNVYHHYSGQGGIEFSNWFRRLLFAWEKGDINIMLSDYIQPNSRIQFWRSIQERINRITPFLTLDDDPYLVKHDGRLVWIQDAYTTSSKYPYSEPYGQQNYIRNPVKIVVDAYEGSVDYYVVDDEDPVIQIYQDIFPDMFQPADQAPEGLEEHFRYPVNLFEAQLELYNRYHMTNPRVFYNDEDRWARPNEQYAGRRQRMEPYYVLGRLPGEDTAELEFKLISPVTPRERNNMIAWIAARSDPENYGELVAYNLPPDRLILGPSQIESRIDQDPEISRQIALWDQRGSRVIRGNLLVVPIENSFMYVEPVFLLADEEDIPQLQRVIVAVGEEISMQPTIQAAMIDLFGDDADFLQPEVEPDELITEEELEELAEDPDATVEDVAPPVQQVDFDGFEEVRSLWRDLREAMEAGNWARYGELLDELDELIEEGNN